MRIIKLYEEFNYHKHIDIICKNYNIDNYTINSDGSIDVNESVNLNYCNLTELPLKFNKVNGGFFCYNNKLTTLEGCPKEVVGNFECNDNQLITLEGGPISVGGDFMFYDNRLTSLKGSPKEVGGCFACNNNQLTSLEGGPEEVGEFFDCSGNQLTSLEGGPTKVGSTFYCGNNRLTSLEGCPSSLIGIECGINPVYEVWKLIYDTQYLEVFLDYDIIRDDSVIILDRLNDLLDLIGKPKVTSVKGYKCI